MALKERYDRQEFFITRTGRKNNHSSLFAIVALKYSSNLLSAIIFFVDSRDALKILLNLWIDEILKGWILRQVLFPQRCLFVGSAQGFVDDLIGKRKNGNHDYFAQTIPASHVNKPLLPWICGKRKFDFQDL